MNVPLLYPFFFWGGGGGFEKIRFMVFTCLRYDDIRKELGGVPLVLQ